MQNKDLFLKKFQEFIAIAGSKEMSLQDITNHFAPEVLDAAQLALLKEYLENKKEKLILTQEEEEYLREYNEEISAFSQIQDEERMALIEEICEGAYHKTDRLIEWYLPKVVARAKLLHKEGFFIGDMIQNGNIGLTIAANQLEEATGAHEFLLEAIDKEISHGMHHDLQLQNQDNELIERVKFLEEALSKLERDLARKPTVDELAVEMALEQKDVLDILKLTGENVDEEDLHLSGENE